MVVKIGLDLGEDEFRYLENKSKMLGFTVNEFLRDILFGGADIKKEERQNEIFLRKLKLSPAYRNINVDGELAKMDVWLSSHKGRKKTKRFIVAWLNRASESAKEIKTNVIVDDSSDQWDAVVALVKRGFLKCPDNMNPRLKSAVIKCGGLKTIGQTSEAYLGSIKKSFIEAYRGAK